MKREILCLFAIGMILLQGCGSTGNTESSNSDINLSDFIQGEPENATQDTESTEITEIGTDIISRENEETEIGIYDGTGSEEYVSTNPEAESGSESERSESTDTTAGSENSESNTSIYMTETTDELLNPELFYRLAIEGTEYDVPLDYNVLVGYGFYAEDPDGPMQDSMDLLNDNYPGLTLTVDTGISYHIKEEDLYEGGINEIEFDEPWNGFTDGYLDIRFQGIGLYSTAEEVLEVFGQPNRCKESTNLNEVTYYYETEEKTNGGALTAEYKLVFRISSEEGYVTGINFTGPAK